jgi:hypothetical protein
MLIDEAKEKLISAAIDWRIADEAEPIPSNVVKEKQFALALSIDDYLNCQPELHHALLRNYKSPTLSNIKHYYTYLIQNEIDLLKNNALEATAAYMKRTGDKTHAARVVAHSFQALEDGYTLKPWRIT